MTSQGARRLAEQLHAEAMDRYGAPLLDHVRRVAADVPPEARAVAWLHESIECASVSGDALRAAGATADEVRAVELLTRDVRETDVGAYRAHVERIARAPGRAGELARIVKRADLQDRLRHERDGTPSAMPRPPYRSALVLLAVPGR